MRPPRDTVTFVPAEAAVVEAWMGDLAAGHDGWINLQPGVLEDGSERPPGLFGVFSAGGPPVPLCTWSPGERRRRGVEPASVGVQHAAGPKAKRFLAEAGCAVPDGWRVVQDHPRRGLVVRPAEDASHAAVLGWLLRAGEVLCQPPLTGSWRAARFSAED